ncbi:MAG: flavin-containing monooxygenase [Saprospiraceae bacterium]
MPDFNVAVIGAGISGIAAAHILQKNGFKAVVFEKSEKLGGVWFTAYPDVHLQNIYTQYRLSDFPWSFQPDLHPTREQILRYLNEAVQHLQIDVRTGHEVQTMTETADGWLVRYHNKIGTHEQHFDFVLIATGQYSDGKNNVQFPGQEKFSGTILTERDVHCLDLFDNKQVAVVGFGKSALDMTVLAAERGAQVHHVFRTPSWLIPEWILGAHFTHALFTRFGNVMMTSWGHPTLAERFLHRQLKFVVSGFWKMITAVIKYQLRRNGRDKNKMAKDRLETLIPRHELLADLRSSGALGPENYYPLVAEGRILPYHSEVAGFTTDALLLKDGRKIATDLVVMSIGFLTPSFPFLPNQYRALLESETDGVQLYRHLLHPRIPRLAFAGYNHGYMHVPAVEVGTQWLCAYWRNEIQLPSVETMEQSIERMRAWKRQHIRFEHARSCAVSTRFQQYLDVMLQELGVSPYRKLPNVLAELFIRYEAADYKGIYEKYEQQRKRRKEPLKALPIDM